MKFFNKKMFLRRRQYIINQDFQFRYMGLLIGITCIICLVFVLAAKYYINLNLDSLLESGMISSPVIAQLIDIEKKFLNKNLLTIFLVLVSILTIVGIFITHRIAGPIFALERRMKEITKFGIEDKKFQIRKGDEFRELVETFNEMIESLEKRYKKDQTEEVKQNKAA